MSGNRAGHDFVTHIVFGDLFKTIARGFVNRNDTILTGCEDVLPDQNRRRAVIASQSILPFLLAGHRIQAESDSVIGAGKQQSICQ